MLARLSDRLDGAAQRAVVQLLRHPPFQATPRIVPPAKNTSLSWRCVVPNALSPYPTFCSGASGTAVLAVGGKLNCPLHRKILFFQLLFCSSLRHLQKHIVDGEEDDKKNVDK